MNPKSNLVRKLMERQMAVFVQMFMSFLKGTILFSWLSGYRTYIIVFIGAVLNILEGGLGWDIPGFTADPNWIQNLLMLLGLGAVRAAVPVTKTNIAQPK